MPNPTPKLSPDPTPNPMTTTPTTPDLIALTAAKLVKLEKALRFAETRLATMPAGALYIRKEKGVLRYYNHDSAKGTFRYLDANSTAEIRLLEEKNYLTKLIRSLTEEKDNLERVQTILGKTEDWENVFFGIREEKRHLIEPVDVVERRTGKKEMEAWNAIPKKRNVFETPNRTMNGEFVKSKSELIIADRLKAAGVPYHYEAKNAFADEELGEIMLWHPDFLVLNVRTGKQYIWEHFGKMDDPEYFGATLFKLNLYARNDYFLGDNLIMTMENSHAPLDTGYVDLLIKRYLI